VDILLSVVTVISTLQHVSTDKVSHISSSLYKLRITVTYELNLVINISKLRGHVIINHSNIHRAFDNYKRCNSTIGYFINKATLRKQLVKPDNMLKIYHILQYFIICTIHQGLVLYLFVLRLSNAPYQLAPLLNLCPLIFVLMLFLSCLFPFISFFLWEYHFLFLLFWFTPSFSGTQLGCKTWSWCIFWIMLR
jgi:hypothetical protein